MFTVFLAIVAGLMALALLTLFVTLIVLAVRSRDRASAPIHYRGR
jgi:hypothetical protein